MEGGWRRGLSVAALAVALIGTAVGCGDDGSSAETVRTATPEKTFAPVVLLAAEERWRPMRARWFIERSVLWFAEDGSCKDRKIAVGHTMPEQWTERFNWIFPRGLGLGPQYYRDVYEGPQCRLNFDVRVHANDPSRPGDPGPRVKGLHPQEGFYLDLADDARRGPRELSDAEIYVERSDGADDSEVRLTYWMLFGMHAPPDRPKATHEGDWERVEVLLRNAGDERYEPKAVVARGRATPWKAVAREGLHPVVSTARGSHAPALARRTHRCDGCVRWRTWQALAKARTQPWYGFGGAWGELGPTNATTGPLGPHGDWPTGPDDYS